MLSHPEGGGREAPEKGDGGVFARAPMRKGETVAVWGGEVVGGQTASRLLPELVRLGQQVDEDHYLLTTEERRAAWIVHACEPNAGLCGQIVPGRPCCDRGYRAWR